jgi:hypothetical protein
MTFRLPGRGRLGLLAVTLATCVAGSLPIVALADQWVSPVTPTQVLSSNSGGLYTQLITAEAVVNPANCPSADSYIVHDAALVNSALAIASAALIAGRQLKVYVTSSSCDPQTGRPLVTSIGLL